MMREGHVAARFWLNIDPPTVTAQEHKLVVQGGKPRFYKPPELADAEEMYKAYLIRNKPPSKLTCPVALYVQWFFRTGNKRMDGMWKPSKPDTDNLDKLLKDCMTMVGFWLDDAQVVFEQITKQWALNPGIMITVVDLTQVPKEDITDGGAG